MSASLFSSGYSIPNTVADGLFVSIGGGSNTVTGLTVSQAAQTLTMTARTTNYGYIDPVTGLVAVNTTGFVSGQIPLFIAVADTFNVTTINDVRVTYTAAAGGGSGVPAAPVTSVQFNNAGAFGGSANLTFNNTNSELIVGPVTARTNAFNGVPSVIIQEQAGFNPLEIHSGHATGIDMYAHAATAGRDPTIDFLRSRGTQASPTSILNGDAIGGLLFGGYDSTQYQANAAIAYQASEDWNPTSTGTHLGISVCSNGTTSSKTAITCEQNTFVGIGNVGASPLFQLQTAPGNSVNLGAFNAAPTDGNMGLGTIVFYLDEAGNNLKVRVKYSNGTLKTATIALV